MVSFVAVSYSGINIAQRALGVKVEPDRPLCRVCRAVMGRQRPRLAAFCFCFLVVNKAPPQFIHCTVNERADVLI